MASVALWEVIWGARVLLLLPWAPNTPALSHCQLQSQTQKLHSLYFLRARHVCAVCQREKINQQAEKKRSQNCNVHHPQVFTVYCRACEKQSHKTMSLSVHASEGTFLKVTTKSSFQAVIRSSWKTLLIFHHNNSTPELLWILTESPQIPSPRWEQYPPHQAPEGVLLI